MVWLIFLSLCGAANLTFPPAPEILAPPLGSGKVYLQLLALRVTEVCLRNRNKFFPVWIPRGDNTTADDMSPRFEVDCDDCMAVVTILVSLS